ncbi:MAG: helix-turn-helix domain-containing protein [Actinobacteria bacterium]|nr:helix-turn-helix domain-containing protein [Actinomycetota bacterium]
MSASNIGAALVAGLDDDDLRALAARLGPFLSPAMPATSTGLVSAREAAAILQLHEGTVTRLARAGRILGAAKVGGRWRFDPNALASSPQPAETIPAAAPSARRRPRPRQRPTTAPRRSRVADAMLGH